MNKDIQPDIEFAEQISFPDQYNTLNLKILQGSAVLYLAWKGSNLTKDQIQQGFIRANELRQQYNSKYIINDNRKLIGVWDQPLKELEEIIFPAIQQAGIKKFAHIVSPDVFANLSAAIFSAKAKEVVDVKLCQSYDEALEWISEES